MFAQDASFILRSVKGTARNTASNTRASDAPRENNDPEINRIQLTDQLQKDQNNDSEDIGIINERIDRILRLIDRNARSLHEGRLRNKP